MNTKIKNFKKLFSRIINLLFNNLLIQRIFIISLSLLIVLGFFLSPAYDSINLKIYDAFLVYAKKPVKQDESLVLIDIDDDSMKYLNLNWPISRKYHADVIEVLTEFNAKAVVFDIEFLEESAANADTRIIENTKQDIMNKFQLIIDDYSDTTNKLSKYPGYRNNLNKIWEDFNIKISQYYIDIEKNIDSIQIDYDKYFSDRIFYNSKVYGTVNMNFDSDTDIKKDDEIYKRELEYLKKFGYKKEDILKNKKTHSAIVNANISQFPVDEILNQYKSVGFTKVRRDKDGLLRNIYLFMERDGYIIPQLALRPFLDIYNIKPEQIDLSKSNYIIFKDVELKGKKVNIKIPIIKNYMNINWPNGQFQDIFANKKIPNDNKKYHFSYRDLLHYKYVTVNQFEESFYRFGLFDKSSNNYNDYENYLRIKDSFNSLVTNKILNDEMKQQYFDYLNGLYNDLKDRVNNDNIIKIEDYYNKIINNTIDQNEKDLLLNNKEKHIKIYKDLKESLDILLISRDQLSYLKDKVCFIGHTATGTTDIGSNPFDESFENVATHPSVFNTILQRDFIYIVNDVFIFIITVLLFGIMAWFLMKSKSFNNTLIGFLSVLLALIFIIIFYRFTNYYITPVIPFLYGFLCFLIMIVLKFVISEKAKSSIRNAFNKYLSPEYIDELLKDQTKLKLGGDKKECTAFFTDIEGFSTISEKFQDDATGLVNFLKEYLSIMSNIILENRGTIDKYIGDAIVAFFGAPLDLPDHAFRACLSSIRIKQAEIELNKKVKGQKIITRIGINTGPMLVGNMGTDSKFNYTMMGHSVNLASRLEGVNKQYHTYQLISEYTYQMVKDLISVRKLDRVRVVNIKTPVRLYELIALTEELNKEQKEFINTFERALDEFEKRNWKEALTVFKEVIKIKKDDAATQIYIDRCNSFIKKDPIPSWDGVYNLVSK